MNADIDFLRDVTFGDHVAEHEGDALARYFVETNAWHAVRSGKVDIVYGPKGAGKSAIYSLLHRNRLELAAEKRIDVVEGENPRGTPAFHAIACDPPTSEREFVTVWKLYIAALAGQSLATYREIDEAGRLALACLRDAGLLIPLQSRESLLMRIISHARRVLKPTGVEAEVKVDPVTGIPTGLVGRIKVGETDDGNVEHGAVPIDNLVKVLDDSLLKLARSVWILLDRLDVAFSENDLLEENALRALFKVYNDLRVCERIELKIFLRSDIWRRITSKGFREATHITRQTTLSWSKVSLLNLIVRRAIQNDAVTERYDVDTTSSTDPLLPARASGSRGLQSPVLESIDTQIAFFYKLVPAQVERGSRKPNTLDWILRRTADGKKLNTPREIIHLMNGAIQCQLEQFDIGGYRPESGRLFAAQALRDAMHDVSTVRLERTLYAEFPRTKEWIERLRGERTTHSVTSLAELWDVTEERSLELAEMLSEVGFFERRGTKRDTKFWIPFLYRSALDIA